MSNFSFADEASHDTFLQAIRLVLDDNAHFVLGVKNLQDGTEYYYHSGDMTISLGLAHRLLGIVDENTYTDDDFDDDFDEE